MNVSIPVVIGIQQGYTYKEDYILMPFCYFLSEENVWHLCKRVQENTPALLPECYAVFISNDQQAVPLWCQAAGDNECGLVQWVGDN